MKDYASDADSDSDFVSIEDSDISNSECYVPAWLFLDQEEEEASQLQCENGGLEVVFGNFNQLLDLKTISISTAPLIPIKPQFDGFTIKIGEISCYHTSVKQIDEDGGPLENVAASQSLELDGSHAKFESNRMEEIQIYCDSDLTSYSYNCTENKTKFDLCESMDPDLAKQLQNDAVISEIKPTSRFGSNVIFNHDFCLEYTSSSVHFTVFELTFAAVVPVVNLLPMISLNVDDLNNEVNDLTTTLSSSSICVMLLFLLSNNVISLERSENHNVIFDPGVNHRSILCELHVHRFSNGFSFCYCFSFPWKMREEDWLLLVDHGSLVSSLEPPREILLCREASDPFLRLVLCIPWLFLGCVLGQYFAPSHFRPTLVRPTDVRNVWVILVDWADVHSLKMLWAKEYPP